METLAQKGKQQKVEELGLHWWKAYPPYMRSGFHPQHSINYCSGVHQGYPRLCLNKPKLELTDEKVNGSVGK